MEEKYSHGSYGDDLGVTFYGPPINGFWNDRVDVSYRFLIPLFKAILERAGEVPRLVTQWNHLDGWNGVSGRTELSIKDIQDFIDALAQLTVSDVASHCHGAAPQECLECASASGEFLGTHLAQRSLVFIEND